MTTVTRSLDVSATLIISVSAFCEKCNKYIVGSCIKWKPQLRNYMSHTKNKNTTCRTVKHFIHEYNDSHVLFKYLVFFIIHVFNNEEHLSENDIESLLLQKKKTFRLGL